MTERPLAWDFEKLQSAVMLQSADGAAGCGEDRALHGRRRLSAALSAPAALGLATRDVSPNTELSDEARGKLSDSTANTEH